MLFFCNAGVSSQAGLHQQDVYYEADYEGPYVVDRVDECPECTLYSEVCKEWEDECQNPCDDCCYVEAAGVPVSAFSRNVSLYNFKYIEEEEKEIADQTKGW